MSMYLYKFMSVILEDKTGCPGLGSDDEIPLNMVIYKQWRYIFHLYGFWEAQGQSSADSYVVITSQ